MSRALPIVSQSDYLTKVVDTDSHNGMTDSAYPDQLASEEVCKVWAYRGSAGPGLIRSQ